METRQRVILIVVLVLVGASVWFFFGRDTKKADRQIDLNNTPRVGTVDDKPKNPENVSAIAGVACPDWKRRPIAVMQPADVTARPAAGFSDADMVIEMPVITATINRLMAVYQCTLPTEAGAVRSSRHDFLQLAKGLDAIYVHWGGSHFALDRIKEGILDNIDCTGAAGNSAGEDVCYRAQRTGTMKLEDTSRVNVANVFERSKTLGYRTENGFQGYPHREEVPVADRPAGGHVRIGYPGVGEVEYFYDKESNTWKRLWGNVADTDRNNGARIAPKNIAVIFSRSEQIEGQYNNMQLGDPWDDVTDSGDALYFIEGKQQKGAWKKDKSNLASKLTFFDESGQEVKFIPGQIWVNVVEPGTALDWQSS
jgi:hypothetical protein